MRFAEALKIGARRDGTGQRRVHLLCGCEPLHLVTFLKAYLRQRFEVDVPSVSTGLFGDLQGNMERAAAGEACDGAIVLFEWSDLDSRLGSRSAAAWNAALLDDISQTSANHAEGLLSALAALGKTHPVVLAGPTLPLLPLSYFPTAQASPFELHLRSLAARFLEHAAELPGVRVLSETTLAMHSSPAARHDLKLELNAGFPYTLPHADALSQQAVLALFPHTPRKGLITDLDNTLWKGILGDDGVDGIGWSLEAKAHVHTLYQQMLGSLADSGVLLAIASKNDPALVAEALKRPDLLLQASQIYPVEASWGPKSDAVGRILAAWNIAADSVVFIDDNPMELAEVAEQHPGLEALAFTPDDPTAVAVLLRTLRDLFGKQAIRDEDRLRLSSLRTSAEHAGDSGEASSADFIARLQARIDFAEVTADDQRIFELANKTNQFNLNGRRYTEAEWRARASQPGQFLVSVQYQDRFGPLGRIAAVGGQVLPNGEAHIDLWVMSCRAFSRQIEFHTLHELFLRTGSDALLLAFTPTERNGPLQTTLHTFFPEGLGESPLRLSREAFLTACPTLTHEVHAPWTPSETR